MTVKGYLAKIFDGMAKGLFASLIIGTIICQVGVYAHIKELIIIGTMAKLMMGPCIGAGVALSRGSKTFTILAASVAGALGAGLISNPDWVVNVISKEPILELKTMLADQGYIKMLFTDKNLAMLRIPGEPVGAFVAALVGVEVGKLFEGKSKFDLLFIPALVIIAGGFTGLVISPYISDFISAVGNLINELTTLDKGIIQCGIMGILLGIIVGVILTLPFSSAALCIAMNISGLAAGAALAGCCAQMVGFAVSSYRENKISGLLSQGIGTSMLQIPNIIKNPLILIPPTIASGICGLLSTTLFKMETTKVGAGMGTSGLVGPLQTYDTMIKFESESAGLLIGKIIVLYVLFPAIITLFCNELMRKKDWIKAGDMKLS